MHYGSYAGLFSILCKCLLKKTSFWLIDGSESDQSAFENRFKRRHVEDKELLLIYRLVEISLISVTGKNHQTKIWIPHLDDRRHCTASCGIRTKWPSGRRTPLYVSNGWNSFCWFWLIRATSLDVLEVCLFYRCGCARTDASNVRFCNSNSRFNALTDEFYWKSRECDGVKDCVNGIDESNCRGGTRAPPTTTRRTTTTRYGILIFGTKIFYGSNNISSQFFKTNHHYSPYHYHQAHYYN